MKKQILSGLLFLIAVVAGCIPGHSQTAKVGDIIYAITSVNNETVAIVAFDVNKFLNGEGSYSGNIVIPETVRLEGKTYTVALINPNAFTYSDNLKSIYIPKTVKGSGFVFSGCKNLTKVEISAENPHIVSENGILYTKDRKIVLGVLPAMAKGAFNLQDGVETIVDMAFSGCDEMTSVTFPKSLTSFYTSCFIGCDKLASVSVSPDNTTYESINGCVVLKNDKALGFVPTGISGDFIIPDGISYISEKAFYGCNNLRTVTIPESVYCWQNVFYNCTGLETINLNTDHVDVIARIANGCSNLKNINIGGNSQLYTSIDGVAYSKDKKELVWVPNGRNGEFKVPEGVTTIGREAFYNCVKLTAIDFPKTLAWIHYSTHSYGTSYAFENNPALERLIIRGELTNGLENLKRLDSSKVVIYALNYYISYLSKYYSGAILPIDNPYLITELKTFIKGVSFKVLKNEEADDSGNPLKVKIDGQEITPDINGVYRRYDLKENTRYSIDITDCEPYVFTTKKIVVDLQSSSKQKSITITGLNISTDETFRFDKYGFSVNGKDYDFSGKNITISELKPSKGYSFTPYVYVNGIQQTLESMTRSTIGVSVSLKSSDIGPTSVVLKGSYNNGELKVLKTYFTDGTTTIEGESLTFVGLVPNTEQTIQFVVECEDNYTAKKIVTITTKNLELTTLQPKGVSSTCSIVAASTNMSSEETGAGFQWKKYDAPASLKASEGYAAIYDGQLEGYLKNLQSTSYYNVRAFYKSNSGKYYYGDWITFDPSDFSFFEPTVHTYAATEISHNTATVKGYVMAGTDDIVSQGFEYWSSNNQARMMALAPIENENVKTVLSNGQVMRVTLNGLEPETEYTYRAFVTTSAGTKYGEEQTFTTANDFSGIGNVAVNDSTTKTVVGYYDMNGRRYDSPRQGFNIIVYSDGSTEKVFLR